MGVDASDYVNFTKDPAGDVSSAETRAAAVAFVSARAHRAGAVLVFGGPPCQRYSGATSDTSRYPARYKSKAADEALHAAIRRRADAALALALTREAGQGPPSAAAAPGGGAWAAAAGAAVALAAAEAALYEAVQAEAAAAAASRAAHEAARDEAMRDAAAVSDADALVKDFLNMYKQIEAEAYAVGVPCFLVMENPYSTRSRALWAR